MKTLVWTRGELFPLDQPEGRLKCPRCGSRGVKAMFDIPDGGHGAAAKATGVPADRQSNSVAARSRQTCD
jgi:hypothetical protein